MTEKRIKELAEGFMCNDWNDHEELQEQIENFIDTVAAEAREEGINEVRDAAKVKFAWCAEGRKERYPEYVVGLADAITLLEQEAERLKEEGR